MSGEKNGGLDVQLELMKHVFNGITSGRCDNHTSTVYY